MKLFFILHVIIYKVENSTRWYILFSRFTSSGAYITNILQKYVK